MRRTSPDWHHNRRIDLPLFKWRGHFVVRFSGRWARGFEFERGPLEGDDLSQKCL
jgi:hypothetical protein